MLFSSYLFYFQIEKKKFEEWKDQKMMIVKGTDAVLRLQKKELYVFFFFGYVCSVFYLIFLLFYVIEITQSTKTWGWLFIK